MTTLTSGQLGLLVAVIGLGGVVVGALVAGGFALLTSWLDSRREHRRWEREKRYQAYVGYLARVDVYLWMVRADRLKPATLSEFRIIGPNALYEAAGRIYEASTHWLLKKGKPGSPALEEAMAQAKVAYVDAVRQVLGIRQ